MPRHSPPALRPVDPPSAAAVADSPDELAEGVFGMKKACEFLDVSEWQLRNLVQTGRVQKLQDSTGCRLYFSKLALKRYLESLRANRE